MTAARSLRHCLIALLLAYAASAHGHARLVKAEPAARATVSVAPTTVRLWFNERIEPRYATAEVIDSGGRVVSSGPAAVAGDDPKRMEVRLGSLAPGVYRVRYRVLSVDGHVVEASHTFAVKAAR